MTRRSILALFLIGILLTSCGGTGEATPDVGATIAANAQTMVAALFQTQTALAPTVTITAIPTLTPLSTSTAFTLTPSSPTALVLQPVYLSPTPTGTFYTSTPLASSLGVGCKNLYLIQSYTDPEGPFLPGQDFTQYWQVENNGTCEWLYTYAVEFASGDKFRDETSVRLGKRKFPEETTTIGVTMHAPKKSGNYKASWRMTDGAGTQFGAVLPVDVKVVGETNTPKPPTATPNLQQTADAANTALAAVQQTAVCAQTPAADPSPNPPCQ